MGACCKTWGMAQQDENITLPTITFWGAEMRSRAPLANGWAEHGKQANDHNFDCRRPFSSISLLWQNIGCDILESWIVAWRDFIDTVPKSYRPALSSFLHLLHTHPSGKSEVGLGVCVLEDGDAWQFSTLGRKEGEMSAEIHKHHRQWRLHH